MVIVPEKFILLSNENETEENKVFNKRITKNKNRYIKKYITCGTQLVVAIREKSRRM